jgi:hypothetical protein
MVVSQHIFYDSSAFCCGFTTSFSAILYLVIYKRGVEFHG